MSKLSLRRRLRDRVLHLNSEIAKAERESARSDLVGRVKLMAKARILRQRRSRLQARLSGLDEQPEGVFGNFNAELAEGAHDVRLAIQRWVDKY